jgi:hypothetical protein
LKKEDLMIEPAQWKERQKEGVRLFKSLGNEDEARSILQEDYAPIAIALGLAVKTDVKPANTVSASQTAPGSSAGPSGVASADSHASVKRKAEGEMSRSDSESKRAREE